MFNQVRRQALIALCLMTFLVCGAAAAEASDTHGADRTVKGAVIGAAVGAVTQIARGRREGVQILKGAAVGGAVGAAVGAYSDYRQERRAREEDYYRYGGYRHGGYRDYRGYTDYRGAYRNRGGYYSPSYYAPGGYADQAPVYYSNGRAHRGGHKHRCQ